MISQAIISLFVLELIIPDHNPEPAPISNSPGRFDFSIKLTIEEMLSSVGIPQP
ncbi:hypothetical protein GW796_08695 [archaeon]|nr:hypothetical protein [archaeon]NCQ51956.1 hypothetical protein [archaeon]